MHIHVATQTLRDYRRAFQALESLKPGASLQALPSPRSVVPRGHLIVFPGSFNPPTRAHLAMLKQGRKFARQQGGHWQMYAALSKQIVDKETVERMTLLDRVVLLERVLKREVKDAGVLLLNRGLYVEQAQSIRTAFPQVRSLFFLLGFDKMVQILDPRYYADREAALRELFHLTRLLVAPRGTDRSEALRQLLARPENQPFAPFIRYLPLAAEYSDVSSTQIRSDQEALASALPAQARDFIAYAHPYESPLSGTDGRTIDRYAERTQALQRLLSD